MYTDTKNLELASQTNMTYARLHATKSKGRLGRVWKPLMRLITSKTPHNNTTNDSCPNNKHPNNINLNNVNQPTIIHEESRPHLIVELPSKAVLAEDLQLGPKMVKEVAEVAFLKSASIEKTPAHICQNCEHGLNCQHKLHEQISLEKVHTSTTHDLNIGWSEMKQKIADEQLLNAWYYYNYQQVAAVQASLC